MCKVIAFQVNIKPKSCIPNQHLVTTTVPSHASSHVTRYRRSPDLPRNPNWVSRHPEPTMAPHHQHESGTDGNHTLNQSSRPHRSTRRNVRYDLDNPTPKADLEHLEDHSEDSSNPSVPHEISNRRMGVIRKKTATRGGEGGVKYVCDVCSADITSTVSACASSAPLMRSSHSSISGPHSMRPQRLQ